MGVDYAPADVHSWFRLKTGFQGGNLDDAEEATLGGQMSNEMRANTLSQLEAELQLRLGLALAAQPLLHRVPAQPGAATDLSDGKPIPQVHSPDLGQHAHVDHS